MEKTRVCTKCLAEKPIEEFYRSNKGKNGRRERCKTCVKAYEQANSSRIRAYHTVYYAEHAVEAKERAKQWALTNPERARARRQVYQQVHREEIRTYAARWRAVNSVRMTAQHRRWRQDHLDRHRENNTRWRNNNRERYRGQMRRAKVLRRVGKNAESAAYALAVARDPCPYCGGISTTVDHVVPVTIGGENTWDNLTAACAWCNRSKGDRSLLLHLVRNPLSLNLEKGA